MEPVINAISSMATRQVLNDLAAAWQARGGPPVRIESVGGVDAARRVSDGREPLDLVFLASDALARLRDAGRLVPDSVVALMRSEVAVAVPAGAEAPAIDSEAALRAAVLAAPTIGYSTGPSGVGLQRLFERWGIADTVAGRIVQAPPGVPVGSLIAQGQVALGFQQFSELNGLPGLRVLGRLPDPVQISTTFCGAVVAGSRHAADAGRLLAFLAGPDAAALKQRHGMAPA